MWWFTSGSVNDKTEYFVFWFARLSPLALSFSQFSLSFQVIVDPSGITGSAKVRHWEWKNSKQNARVLFVRLGTDIVILFIRWLSVKLLLRFFSLFFCFCLICIFLSRGTQYVAPKGKGTPTALLSHNNHKESNILGWTITECVFVCCVFIQWLQYSWSWLQWFRAYCSWQTQFEQKWNSFERKKISYFFFLHKFNIFRIFVTFSATPSAPNEEKTLKVPKKKSLKRLLCRETTSFTWHLCHFIKTFLIMFLARGFVSWTGASSTLPHQSRSPSAKSFVRTIKVTSFDQYCSELN